MPNIMNLVKLKNNPSRNGFDLSRKRNFTAKVGELLPALVLPVIPGDYVNIDLTSMTRTAPLNTSAFARVREYYDFFFVPYQLLWNKANTVLSQMNYNQQHATGLSFDNTPLQDELPHLSTQNIAQYVYNMIGQTTGFGLNYFGFNRGMQTVKLLEYLDYGTYMTSEGERGETVTFPVDVNLMALLAYQKIYADFYRDQQWESPNPSSFNVDYITGQTSTQVTLPTFNATTPDPFYSDYNMFDMRYCNWQKDLYHGLLPAPQYGETAVVPINGGGSVSGNVSFTIPAQELEYPNGYSFERTSGQFINASGQPVSLFNKDADGNNYYQYGELGIPDSPGASNLSEITFAGRVPSVDVTAPISSSRANPTDGGLSILALRQYEFLQKYREIQQSNDQDYKAQIKAIWGVDVPNALSEQCTYLGGTSTSLDINEVVNTNLTGDNAANIQGKGISVNNGKVSFKSDGQFGVIMCIYHVLPIVDYTANIVDHQHLLVNAADFPNPVFDRVGMESVTSLGLDMSIAEAGRPLPTNPSLLGYAPRYINYKTAIDTSVGAFKRSLSNWVLSYPFVTQQNRGDDDHFPVATPAGSLDYTFFKMSPHVVDPIFVLEADDTMDTDQFWVSSFMDIKAVRNLDVNGLPY